MWAEYLDGATAAYARYGVGEAIHRSDLEDGDGVTIFVVGRRPDGTVKAGLRFHGPLNRVEDSLSLVEMALSPEVPQLTEQIRRYVPHGVIEIKGAWAAAKGSGPHSMFKSFNRCVVYTLHWLRCEFAIATLAEQHVEPVVHGGAHHLSVDSVPFPSEEYQTRLMVWRRSRLIDTTEPEQILLERTELGHLARPQLKEASAVLEDKAWRPLVLDCRHRSDRAIAQRLANTGTRTIDRLDAQRAELAELRPAVPAAVIDEAPRFVYYPWRKTICKLVGPKGFDRSGWTATATRSPERAGDACGAAHRGRRPERRPHDRPPPGHGGPVRRAAAGRLRRHRAVEPQPDPGQPCSTWGSTRR